jgi:hypothetical protein
MQRKYKAKARSSPPPSLAVYGSDCSSCMVGCWMILWILGREYNCDCIRDSTYTFVRRWVYIRVQWFWLFFTFWGITTHPWHPKGPRVWKLANKNFQLHPWPAEIFGKNRKMRFFGMISKFNFRSPAQQIFTIFSACFIYGVLNTHTKF